MPTNSKRSKIVVAGHICLDIIPEINSLDGGLESMLVPGKLINVGAVSLSLGGAVSNTGLALHRLGLPVELMGKVGQDAFGQIILDYLESQNPGLAKGMIRSDSGQTSYTIVISPPGVDRVFLHCPGENDNFLAEHIDYAKVAEANLFHFGYPPLMRSMYENDGRELVKVFSSVKQNGVTTSLDMALADPSSPAGKADWAKILAATLPYVDIFLPSVDEILFMLDRDRFRELQEQSGGSVLDVVDDSMLDWVASKLIEMGASVVVLKLGDKGLYLRTTKDETLLAAMGKARPSGLDLWVGRELYSPCFDVDVVGTTGSGDCTIAGFLAGFARDLAPGEALTTAVAVGACNVEAADATSGVRTWLETQERIKAGWQKRPPSESFSSWHQSSQCGVLAGATDCREE